MPCRCGLPVLFQEGPVPRRAAAPRLAPPAGQVGPVAFSCGTDLPTASTDRVAGRGSWTDGGRLTLAYGGPSRPGGPLKRCERFSREGSRCTNETRHADGWCQQDGCDGFRRASTSSAPPPVRDTPRTEAAEREPVAAAV